MYVNPFFCQIHFHLLWVYFAIANLRCVDQIIVWCIPCDLNEVEILALRLSGISSAWWCL